MSSSTLQGHAIACCAHFVNSIAISLISDVQSVHVKNRCAFLNHSSNAQEFMQLVEQHPNIALWFSVSPELPGIIQECLTVVDWVRQKFELMRLPPMGPASADIRQLERRCLPLLCS